MSIGERDLAQSGFEDLLELAVGVPFLRPHDEALAPAKGSREVTVGAEQLGQMDLEPHFRPGVEEGVRMGLKLSATPMKDTRNGAGQTLTLVWS